MQAVIAKYFPDLSAMQYNQLQQLEVLYKEWNSKINLISRKDMDNLTERHILHSLAIAKVIQFNPNAHILDVGTGGGLPGLPLAILFPDTEFHLIDAIGKKIKVVQAIATALRLDNVTASHMNATQVSSTYDFVVSRAVTQIDIFLSWIQNAFKSHNEHTLANGILYLKGGDLKEELSNLKQKYDVFEIKDFFQEDFFETKKILYIPMKKI